MQKNIIISIFIVFLCGKVFTQPLQGTIYEYGSNGELQALEGVNVLWLGTSLGTITDVKGKFSIDRTNESQYLIVRHVGYEKDTIFVNANDNHIKIVLNTIQELDAVTVSSSDGTYISSKPILTHVITTEGLRRAACCNLSESFESSASVDVSFSDAISGAKQIQMLGLAGVYSQIMVENTPYIRSLSTPFGLMHVPGSWMENISISKGTASVINGYESITGQIDVNYKKPETSKEKLFFNLFFNSMLKSEINANVKIPVKNHASTMFLFHIENQPKMFDDNHDGFTELPLNTQINVMNRWDYDKPGKMEGRTMLSYLYDTRTGGQMDFKRGMKQNPIYGLGVDNHKLNLISKNGILLKGENESIGTIASFTYNDYQAFYGIRNYAARQISGYANVFYENFMDKQNRHKINVGISYQIDAVKETFETEKLNKTESVPGVFMQYSFIFNEKFIAIAGMRLDYNNLYGLLWTPRLHCKWQITEKSALRFTAGKGYRSANPYIENTALMASSRNFILQEKLNIEEAYNTGISFTQSFLLNGNESSFSVDYFYTHFINQIIVNVDKNPQYVYFSNLHGRSFSHAAQAEITISPIKRFEIMLAYRFNYVMESIDGKLQAKPMTNRHKAILNLNYSTKFEKWKFNITAQLHGKTRLPNTSSLPKNLQLDSYSPIFLTLNAQVSRQFRLWEVYLGAENITNYTQKHPIIDAENPFGTYFDASMVYAPLTGIMIYAGCRFTLKTL